MGVRQPVHYLYIVNMPRFNCQTLFFTAVCLWASLFVSPTAAQEVDSVAEAPEVEMIEDEMATGEEEPFLFRAQHLSDSGSVSPRAVGESDLVKLREDEDFWYVNEAPKREAPRKPVSFKFLERTWFKTLMWTLVVGGFIVILIWFLLSSNVQFFQKKSGAFDDSLQSREEENIFEIDYDAEIGKAVVAHDFRLAIRLHYLQLLKELSQKGAIQYSQGSTNSDYVIQLHGKPYGTEFFQLTRSFEYAWYGQFAISKAAFSAIETQFSNLRNQLHA